MAEATYPQLEGEGLALRPWDEDLAEQMGNWGVRGFPYHAFDLLHLKDPVKRALTVESCREEGPHRHFVAVEDGVAVGRVSVNLRDPAGSYIWAVHVPPEHEGRAVCRRMLAVLMRWLEVEHPQPLAASHVNHGESQEALSLLRPARPVSPSVRLGERIDTIVFDCAVERDVGDGAAIGRPEEGQHHLPR